VNLLHFREKARLFAIEDGGLKFTAETAERPTKVLVRQVPNVLSSQCPVVVWMTETPADDPGVTE